jgi:hypothetical protein
MQQEFMRIIQHTHEALSMSEQQAVLHGRAAQYTIAYPAALHVCLTLAVLSSVPLHVRFTTPAMAPSIIRQV